jgi:hypothetical protein
MDFGYVFLHHKVVIERSHAMHYRQELLHAKNLWGTCRITVEIVGVEYGMTLHSLPCHKFLSSTR